MIILLLIVFFVVACIAFFYEWECTCAFCTLGFLGLLIVAACLAGGIVNGRTLDAKIAMYTEENEQIENDINTLVVQYMKYESDTYGALKPESSITLVSMYPELTADTMVSKQIDIYTENNNSIRELKEKLINVSNYKWWLYFGK